jgi:hypothetical protein
MAMADALISEYLGRLNAAVWPLPESRRSELVSEVREHIESALSEAGARDETTVRNVLDRLGRPEDIAAAEAEAAGATGTRTAWRPTSQTTSGWMAQAAARGWGGVEIAAVLLLTVGALLLWWIGPIAGVVLAWFSERWTSHEKRVAAGIVGSLVIVQFVLLAVFMSRAFSPGTMNFGGVDMTLSMPDFGSMALIALLAGLLPILGGLAAGLYLAMALQRQRQ